MSDRRDPGELFSLVVGPELQELINTVLTIGRLHGSAAAAEEWCRVHGGYQWSPDAIKLRTRILRQVAEDTVDIQTAEYVQEYATLQATLVRYGSHAESPAEIEGWFRNASARMRTPTDKGIARNSFISPPKPDPGQPRKMSKDDFARMLISEGEAKRKKP